jgi:hypothetical protein
LGQTKNKRSTLAEAGELRPAIIFEKSYHKLLAGFFASILVFKRSLEMKMNAEALLPEGKNDRS